MPAPPNQAVRPVENNRNKYGPGLTATRKKGFVFGSILCQGRAVIFLYIKKWIRSQKSISASTEVNDSCQPASNKSIGFMSNRIIAANESVFIELEYR